MNNTIKELTERKSVRVFTNRKISQEDKNLILLSAVEAPTAGNQQLYTIIDVTDQSIKDKLSKSCDNQNMISKAKMVLVFCADCKKWYDGYKIAGAEPRMSGEGDLMLACCDAIIAAQNAVVAAESLGIGSCYVGDIMENCRLQREILKLPDYVFPVGMVIFDYPTNQQKERKKPERVKLSYVVHENGYRELSEQELREMWKDKSSEKSFEEWMKAFCNRKYNSSFSIEMTRSVREYLEQYKKEK